MDIGMINAVAIASLARRASPASRASPAHRGRPVNRARSLTPNQRERLRA